MDASGHAAAATPASTLRRGYLCGCVAAVIWGGYLVTSRRGIAAGLAPADMALLRYLIAGLLFLPFLLRNSPATLAGVGWARGLVLACLAGPPFVLVGASGFHYAPLAHAAVIQLGSVVLLSALLASVLLGERPGPSGLASLLLVVLGLIVTAGSGLAAVGQQAWVGDLLFASAGTMWALFTVLQRRWGLSPVPVATAVCTLSAAVYTPLYFHLADERRLWSASIATLLEQGVVQGVLSGAIAMLAFAIAVRDVGAARAALFPALAPGVAMLLGAFLTGDPITMPQLLGLALLTTGLLVSGWGAACRTYSDFAKETR